MSQQLEGLKRTSHWSVDKFDSEEFGFDIVVSAGAICVILLYFKTFFFSFLF